MLLPTLWVSRRSVPPADAHPQSARRDPLTPLLSAVTVHPQTLCDVTVANSGPTLVLEPAVDLTARTGPSHCGAAPGLGSRRRIRASEQPYARHSSSTKTARMPSREPAGKTVRQSLSPSQTCPRANMSAHLRTQLGTFSKRVAKKLPLNRATCTPRTSACSLLLRIANIAQSSSLTGH